MLLAVDDLDRNAVLPSDLRRGFEELLGVYEGPATRLAPADIGEIRRGHADLAPTATSRAVRTPPAGFGADATRRGLMVAGGKAIGCSTVATSAGASFGCCLSVFRRAARGLGAQQRFRCHDGALELAQTGGPPPLAQGRSK